jgi:hypothetical protein
MKGEKGQALPLAMLALTIGSLIIAPFLGHAGTSLISSHTYADVINARSAADAGVEHAIWDLTYGNLAELIPDAGDDITYQLGEALNGYVTSVTVTANSTGGGGAWGDIQDDIIDTLIFGPTGGNMPVIIPVAGNVYAIAYGDWSNDGWVETVTITPDGMIKDTPIDTLKFESKQCDEPDIIQVSGTTYAVVYRGQSNDGNVKTFSIAANGNIGNSVIDTLTYESGNCYEPDIIHASGNYYAVAYRGQYNDGYLKTFTIAANGNIGNSVKDTLEFDTSASYEPCILPVSGNYYAIAYRGSGSRGYLKTVSIAANGNIGNTVIDTFTFNQYSCYYPDITQVSGNIYAISYTGASPANGYWWGGILTTVNISANGTITKHILDEIVFDSNDGDYSDMVYTGNGVYMIAYTGGGSNGIVETIAINADGQITGTIINTLTFEFNSGFYPCIIAIDDDTYAVVYTGSSGWVGVLKTIGLSSGGQAAYHIVSTAGNLTISAFVNSDNATTTIVFWQIQ